MRLHSASHWSLITVRIIGCSGLASYIEQRALVMYCRLYCAGCNPFMLCKVEIHSLHHILGTLHLTCMYIVHVYNYNTCNMCMS